MVFKDLLENRIWKYLRGILRCTSLLQFTYCIEFVETENHVPKAPHFRSPLLYLQQCTGTSWPGHGCGLSGSWWPSSDKHRPNDC